MRSIDIDDLREPRRDTHQQQIYEAALTMEVELDPASLLASAKRRTGLADLGSDPTVLDRLRAQAEAADADSGLSGLGRYMVRRRLVGLLAARLRFEDFIRRYPEALATPLDPPIVVIGLPRSGTTHLVNLLAADTRLRSLPWWEAAEPIPVLGDGPGRDGIDPRFLRSQDDHEATRSVSPLTSYMHDRPPSFIEEECELMDLDFCAYTLEWHARVPTWRDAYFELDQRAHYGFLDRALRVLSFLRGPRRWVLKCPQHLEQTDALLATFPTATVALTLRDPVAVVQSTLTMLAYGDRLRRITIDADELALYWVDRVDRLLRACVRDVGRIDPHRRVDVEFTSFTRNPLPVAEAIATAAGLDVTEECQRQWAAFLATDSRSRDARIGYNLLRDFAIEPRALHERYQYFFDAFPQVRTEVS